MKVFLYAVSFAWVIIGSCYILYTLESRNLVRQFFDEVNERVLAAIIVLFGLMLLISASSVENSWFIVLLGLLGLIKGGLLIVNPHNVFDTIKSWYLDSASDQTYRFFGIVMVVVGTAVFSWI